MLGWLADKVSTSVAVHRLGRDPVVQMGREAIRLNWTASPEMKQTFRSLSKDFVPNIATQMMQTVIGIAAAQDPRMANRQRLVEVVLQLALFTVLLLRPPPHPDATGLRGRPGITGELWERMPELVRKNKELRDFFVPMGGVDNLSPDELRDGITIRRYVLHGWAGMLQTLRMAWHDAVPEPLTDWYRPLVENLCAWEEQQARQLLGMETALGGSGRMPEVESLARFTLMNDVLSGAADPVSEWKEHYKGWNL